MAAITPPHHLHHLQLEDACIGNHIGERAVRGGLDGDTTSIAFGGGGYGGAAPGQDVGDGGWSVWMLGWGCECLSRSLWEEQKKKSSRDPQEGSEVKNKTRHERLIGRSRRLHE